MKVQWVVLVTLGMGLVCCSFARTQSIVQAPTQARAFDQHQPQPPDATVPCSKANVPATLPPLKVADPYPSNPTAPSLLRYLNAPFLLSLPTCEVARFQGRNPDVIFIGDSITQFWVTGAGRSVWENNLAPRNALDFGVSGDRTQHVLWRLDNFPLQGMRPKVGVILIGTNNRENTAPEIADGVKAVLEKTESLFPGIRIILVSIMPNERANDLMMTANQTLRTFADDKTIFYLDLVPLMPKQGDNWKGLLPDKLHPTEAGYQIWFDAMQPLLDRLLGAVSR